MNWYHTAAKDWKRGDWLEMLRKCFELMPHPDGPFKQWTGQTLGAVGFMNARKDIRVDLRFDIYPGGPTVVVVNVGMKSGESSSFTIESQPEDLKKLPHDIVQKVYEHIEWARNKIDPRTMSSDWKGDDTNELEGHEDWKPDDPEGLSV